MDKAESGRQNKGREWVEMDKGRERTGDSKMEEGIISAVSDHPVLHRPAL